MMGRSVPEVDQEEEIYCCGFGGSLNVSNVNHSIRVPLMCFCSFFPLRLFNRDNES